MGIFTSTEEKTIDHRLLSDDSPRKILCIHGWRTSGKILHRQTAAFRHHTEIECEFITAPFPALGPPDSGIAQYYPNEEYFEWFYKHKSKDSTGTELVTYEGVDKGLEYVKDYIKRNGPFHGVLGFSQGAAIATLLAKMQQDSGTHWFRFVILIGGVLPPKSHQKIDKEVLTIPSLHIIGKKDEYYELSHRLKEYYQSDTRDIIEYDEGHQIPSMRTKLYPQFKAWIHSR